MQPPQSERSKQKALRICSRDLTRTTQPFGIFYSPLTAAILSVSFLKSFEQNKKGGSVPSNIWLLPTHALTWRLTSDWIVPTALSSDDWAHGGPTLLAGSSTGLSGFIQTSSRSCQDVEQFAGSSVTTTNKSTGWTATGLGGHSHPIPGW